MTKAPRNSFYENGYLQNQVLETWNNQGKHIIAERKVPSIVS